jgi:hypothetical protein
MSRLGILMRQTRHTTKLQQVQSAVLGAVRALKQQVEVLAIQVQVCWELALELAWMGGQMPK